jgi:ElaB/YqjD/DUF883 family membrane-anchored ribosome-binding protein
MKLLEILFASVLLVSPAMSEDTAAMRAARLRFGQVSTRAVANFRSADTIEARLRAQGSTLHPTLISLRLRIESALDKAEAALAKDDLKTAREQTKIAEGMLDKFARKLGGD